MKNRNKLRIISLLLGVITLFTLSLSLFGCKTLARGKSAYEIAVDNGFVGSEREWLESLRGDKGQNGTDGKDGENFNVGYTAQALYDELVLNGEFSGTFAQFVKEYFGTSTEIIDEQGVINRSMLSAASIICTYPTSRGDSNSAGSGVVYSVDKEKGDCIIITNFHVVYAENSINSNKIATEINAYFYGGESPDGKMTCSFIGGTAKYDIAILEVKGSDVVKNSSVLPITFADSDEATLGETVIALGNAEGAGLAATKGVLSVDSEYIEIKDVYGEVGEIRVMRYDAAVSPGNSGGGLFNGKGELLGIVNAKSIANDVDGIYYSIPSNIVRSVLTHVMRECYGKDNATFDRVFLNVTVVESNSKAVYDERTGKIDIIAQVFIDSVNEGSPVYGLLYENDRVLSIAINGEEKAVSRNFNLVDRIFSAKLGDEVSFKVIRNGEEKTVSFVVNETCLIPVK